MKKLTEQSNLNSGSAYDQIFKDRAKMKPHWQDLRRWKELIRYFKGGYIVDIGCLDSKIWNMVHKKFWKEQNYRYLGTDVAEEAIKEMARKYPYGNSSGEPLCSFIVDNIYNSNIKEEIADYVVLGEVLEHLERPDEVVEKTFKLLKPGGVLAISVPLEEAIEPGAVDGERHLWSYSKQDIENLVKPYSSKVKMKVLRSQYWPTYKYAWPSLIVWAWKK